MNDYVPYLVFENLHRMLKYRSVNVTSKLLSPAAVAQHLNQFDIIIIQGRRESEDVRGPADVLVILIAPGSKNASKSSEFKKLFKGIDKTKYENLELIIVSEEELTTHIKKHLLPQYKQKYNVYIEDYTYVVFKIEIPKHKLVPLHEIATDDEVNEFCNTYYTSKDKFPKLLLTDPMAIWLGARPGMVVKVHRISETAGNAIVYRTVQ